MTVRIISYILCTIFIFFQLSDAVNASWFKSKASLCDETEKILTTLHQKKQLEAKKVAVHGFTNIRTDSPCEILSGFLEEKIIACISAYQKREKINVTVVARSDLAAIEDEYAISKKGRLLNYEGPVSLLESADILITGTWSISDEHITVVLKAIENGKIIASHQASFNSADLDAPVASCTDDALLSNLSLIKLQEKINRLEMEILNESRKLEEYQQRADLLQKIHELDQIKKSVLESPGTVPYTTRNFAGKQAIVDIHTEPDQMSIYINERFVGRSPLINYPVEAGIELVFKVQGDPRYFQPTIVRRKYSEFERKIETIVVERGYGEVWIVGKTIADTLLIDGQKAVFKKTRPIVRVPAGEHRITALYADEMWTFLHDVWAGDLVKIELTPHQKPAFDAEKHFENMLGMQFIRIPPGAFTNGLKKQVVIAKPFYLQTREVTQWQWQALMGTNPSYFKECGDECPVEQVSWNDIQEFIQRLNENDPGSHYRLPDENEWEYACRSGQPRKYCFGDIYIDLDKFAWYGYNSENSTHPTGQKQPSEWGLYDIHGNVREWCAHQPENPANGKTQVSRGGSWSSDPKYLQCCDNSRHDSETRLYNLGFRLVREEVPGDAAR